MGPIKGNMTLKLPLLQPSFLRNQRLRLIPDHLIGYKQDLKDGVMMICQSGSASEAQPMGCVYGMNTTNGLCVWYEKSRRNQWDVCMVLTDQKEPMGCMYGMNRAEGTGSHEYRGQEVQIRIVDREFSPKELKVKVPVHREFTGGTLSHFGALSLF